jgi:hypothetical protein
LGLVTKSARFLSELQNLYHIMCIHRTILLWSFHFISLLPRFP